MRCHAMRCESGSTPLVVCSLNRWWSGGVVVLSRVDVRVVVACLALESYRSLYVRSIAAACFIHRSSLTLRQASDVSFICLPSLPPVPSGASPGERAVRALTNDAPEQTATIFRAMQCKYRCLFLQYPSHRIFIHMYGVLNVVIKNN